MKIMGITSNVPCSIKERLPGAGREAPTRKSDVGMGTGWRTYVRLQAQVREDPVGAGPRSFHGRSGAGVNGTGRRWSKAARIPWSQSAIMKGAGPRCSWAKRLKGACALDRRMHIHTNAQMHIQS